MHFRGGALTLDVLLLSPTAGQGYAPLWREVSFNRVRSVGNSAWLLAEAHRLTTWLVGTSTSESMPSKDQEGVDILVVPPYLDIVVLDIFRLSPAATVEVFPPDAERPLRGGLNGVESLGLGTVLSTFVVHQPVPGSWIVRKSSPKARVRILSQQFFPRGLLLAPASSDSIRQFDRVRVTYSVVDANGRALEELPNYKLALDLALTKPDGTLEPVPMERRPDVPGTVFAAVRENECGLAGRYWTAVGASSVDDRGARVDIFRDRWSGFSVAPASRVDCHEYLGRGAFRGWLRGAEKMGAYRLHLAIDRSRLRPQYNVRIVPDAVTFVRRSTVHCRWLVLLAVLTVLAAITAAVLKRR